MLLLRSVEPSSTTMISLGELVCASAESIASLKNASALWHGMMTETLGMKLSVLSGRAGRTNRASEAMHCVARERVALPAMEDIEAVRLPNVRTATDLANHSEWRPRRQLSGPVLRMCPPISAWE
jgi:hypothetical protein